MESSLTSNTYIASRGAVDSFLISLREILTSSEFNAEQDLDILLKKKHELMNDPFTTQNTLLALGFNAEDVSNQLAALRVHDYYCSVIDNKDPTSSVFHAFIICLDSQNVYIKVKIRDFSGHKVFCVSFHFARYSVGVLPYAS